MSTHNLKPLSEVLKDLKARGYKEDFLYKNNQLATAGGNNSYEADDVTIKDEYRFEGDSDPGDMSILYTIETTDGTKGTLVNSYGADTNVELEDFLKKAHYEANS